MVSPDLSAQPYLPAEAGLGTAQQTLSVYWPGGAKPSSPAACVLYMHHGSFVSSGPLAEITGGGFDYVPFQMLQNHGMVVVNAGLSGVGYTGGQLCLWENVGSSGWNDPTIHNPWKDAQHVIQHIKQNAETYGIDPKRIIFFGISSPSLCTGRVALGPFVPMSGVTSPQGGQSTQLLGWLGHSTVGWLQAYNTATSSGRVFKAAGNPSAFATTLAGADPVDLLDAQVSSGLRRGIQQARNTAVMMVHEEVASPPVVTGSRDANGDPGIVNVNAALHDVAFGQLMVEDLQAAGCPSIVGLCREDRTDTYPAHTGTVPAGEGAFGATAAAAMVAWVQSVANSPRGTKITGIKSTGVRVTGAAPVPQIGTDAS